jgi:hypothetical protein
MSDEAIIKVGRGGSGGGGYKYRGVFRYKGSIVVLAGVIFYRFNVIGSVCASVVLLEDHSLVSFISIMTGIIARSVPTYLVPA